MPIVLPTPEACETIPLQRDTGNLLLSGTVYVYVKLTIIIIIQGLEVY